MEAVPRGGPAKGAVEGAVRKAASGIETLARLGYAAKGAVYVLVGGLATRAAAQMGGRATDSSGALGTISGSSAGRLVLALIALGLAGYVVWSFVRAIRAPESEGTGQRVFFAFTGIVYTLLALEAARLALGQGGGSASGGDGSAAHWSAVLMQQPAGVWLLGLFGVIVGLYALQQLVAAWRTDLDDQLDLRVMASGVRRWTIRFGRFGLAARGVVLAVIGYYLVRAALQASATQARGLGEVLAEMQDQPWLLGLIAVGLVAYGLYNLVRARYRVIRPR